MSAVEIQGVNQRYGSMTVLHDLSLTLGEGEVLGLFGHNGAGKTTSMKLILGLLTPSEGQVRVLGRAPHDPEVRRQLGYLPENVTFYPQLSGRETLRHFARLKGASLAQVDELLEQVGLAHAAERRVKTYSKGMRQRVGLAQALIGQPRLLILDEPTSGLDPVSRREFYAILDGLAAEGAAILLASHALTEVEARTDRIVILSQGRLMANDTLHALRRQAALPIRLQISAHPGAADQVAAQLAGGRRNGVMVDLTCSHHEKLTRLGHIAALKGLIEDVEIIPPSLEDLYSHFSRRDDQ
ncbi:MAG TPA: ABC transporter ATP-binding protein [Pseudomonas sp.]|nr:ABC transporter ATP-binding protein [Pseudomonas sp.]